MALAGTSCRRESDPRSKAQAPGRDYGVDNIADSNRPPTPELAKAAASAGRSTSAKSRHDVVHGHSVDLRGVHPDLAAGGAEPGNMPPWLTIRSATYFWWEAAFIAPVIIAGGVLTTGTLYLLARSAGRSGSFDDTLALLGPAIAVHAVYSVTRSDHRDSAKCECAARRHVDVRHHPPKSDLVLVWTYFSMYILAFLGFPVVAATVHRLRASPAVAIGWASFVVYQGFLLIFVP